MRRGALLIAAVLLPLANAQAADMNRGADLYRMHCANCHGGNGRPVMSVAPDLSSPMALMKPDPALLGAIRAGRGAMPGYQGQLRDRDILDIVAHMRTFR